MIPQTAQRSEAKENEREKIVVIGTVRMA